jgi:hypothetical protein
MDVDLVHGNHIRVIHAVLILGFADFETCKLPAVYAADLVRVLDARAVAGGMRENQLVPRE